MRFFKTKSTLPESWFLLPVWHTVKAASGSNTSDSASEGHLHTLPMWPPRCHWSRLLPADLQVCGWQQVVTCFRIMTAEQLCSLQSPSQPQKEGSQNLARAVKDKGLTWLLEGLLSVGLFMLWHHFVYFFKGITDMIFGFRLKRKPGKCTGVPGRWLRKVPAL